MDVINFDDLRETDKREHEEREKEFYEFLGGLGKANEELTEACRKAAEQIRRSGRQV